MPPTSQAPPAPSLALSDILYVVFRHKWKILLVSAMGMVAAFCVRLVMPRMYESEARLYIRYVLENRTPTEAGESDSRIKSPDARGSMVLNTELEILTSMDLAQQVADAIGPEKLLGGNAAKGTPEGNRAHAAILIQKGLSAEVPKDSCVIRLVFQHPNPEVTQLVLKQLIDSYFKKHVQIHAVGAFDEFLTQETDQRRSRLAQIDDELRKAKAKVGIISLEDTKRAYSEQIARLEQAELDAEAELAERRAAADELAKTLPVTSAALPKESRDTNAVDVVPNETVTEYQRVCGMLDALSRREQELLLTYTLSNSLVQEVQKQLAANQQLKRKLETFHPGLLAVRPLATPTNGPGAATADPRLALNAEMARVSGLESRVKTLKAQLDEIRKKATALGNEEGTITELQRRLALEATNYTQFARSLEQSQIDEKLGAGKVSNISTIQEPSPPTRAASKRMKVMAMVCLGGIAVAFGLAFGIEFYLDRSLKRPSEVETKLGLPLFLSIPRLHLNGKANGESHGLKHRLLPASAGTSDSAPQQSDSQLSTVPWSPNHPLRPFHEALRERLINYFETNNLTHKPKLVALTGCGNGGGVSTLAAGLAAALSETGDGNVLLVDMNLQDGAAHQFFKGDLGCDLDQALELEKRNDALVQDNLYVVTEGKQRDLLPGVLPKRFKNLVPRLKASDYDYIIFDMPPVSQISLTPRLARFMDTVLLVVESEKTDCDVIKRAHALLAEQKAPVGIVLNKTCSYVPKHLQQEL